MELQRPSDEAIVRRWAELWSNGGIAPTGRPVAYEGTVIFRTADGKIVERWGTVDAIGILLQIGATTVPTGDPGRRLQS